MSHPAKFGNRDHVVNRDMSNPLICGVCMIKDAVDLVPFLCGHYLRIGFDRLVFIDDGSTDGTYEALQSISRAGNKIVVEKTGDPVYRQKQVINEAANTAIADGYPIVFPFDSDEFWNIDAARIRIAAKQPGVFVGRWLHFVQDRGQTGFSRRGLLNVRYRAPVFADTSPETVERYERSFVCASMPKIGFRADGPVHIDWGQHQLLGNSWPTLADSLEVFHLPLRAAAAIDLRVALAERTLVGREPGHNWQARFFREATKAGKQAVVWASNSASKDGFLDLPGARVMLIEDRRLGLALRQAWRYMLLRYPARMSRLPAGPSA